MTIMPVRLRLSRLKGFDLQALSLATNGLPAVRVTRPGPFGNPFSVMPDQKPGTSFGHPGLNQTFAVPTAENAVACFDEMMDLPGEGADARRALLPKLRGKNVACFCPLDRPCHGDVWLRRANALVCEPI